MMRRPSPSGGGSSPKVTARRGAAGQGREARPSPRVPRHNVRDRRTEPGLAGEGKTETGCQCQRIRRLSFDSCQKIRHTQQPLSLFVREDRCRPSTCALFHVEHTWHAGSFRVWHDNAQRKTATRNPYRIRGDCRLLLRLGVRLCDSSLPDRRTLIGRLLASTPQTGRNRLRLPPCQRRAQGERIALSVRPKVRPGVQPYSLR